MSTAPSLGLLSGITQVGQMQGGLTRFEPFCMYTFKCVCCLCHSNLELQCGLSSFVLSRLLKEWVGRRGGMEGASYLGIREGVLEVSR